MKDFNGLVCNPTLNGAYSRLRYFENLQPANPRAAVPSHGLPPPPLSAGAANAFIAYAAAMPLSRRAIWLEPDPCILSDPPGQRCWTGPHRRLVPWVDAIEAADKTLDATPLLQLLKSPLPVRRDVAGFLTNFVTRHRFRKKPGLRGIKGIEKKLAVWSASFRRQAIIQLLERYDLVQPHGRPPAPAYDRPEGHLALNCANEEVSDLLLETVQTVKAAIERVALQTFPDEPVQRVGFERQMLREIVGGEKRVTVAMAIKTVTLALEDAAAAQRAIHQYRKGRTCTRR